MKFLTILLLGFIVNFCTPQSSLLERIRARGELRIVTRQALTTYYENSRGKAGLEYDLVKRFAEELGVKLHIEITDDFNKINQLLSQHQVDIAAAGLVVSDAANLKLRFGPSYQKVKFQLIYREGAAPPPTDLAEIGNHKIQVVADSPHAQFLHQLQQHVPQLSWEEVTHSNTSDLLVRVWGQEIPYTLVTSNEMEQMQRFYPELESGLELPDSQDLAWMFARAPQNDDSLYLAAIQFFQRLRQTGELAQLLERYYGHVDEVVDFDYVNTRVFYRHVRERLPSYRLHFEQIAARHQIDWKFLAAMAYEESQWKSSAVSSTGVRGLMQLTQNAAKEVGVQNRDDPFESIEGGAQYFTNIKKRINANIPEPDRTWFALAAYNVGLQHLGDAMQITVQQKDNPHRWVDVKKYLPLLGASSCERLRWGCARGEEPVNFVKRVRHYYDMLALFDEEQLVFSSTDPPSLTSRDFSRRIAKSLSPML